MPNAETVTSISFGIVAPSDTSGQKIRLGVYKPEGTDGAPHTLLADCGEVSLPAVGFPVLGTLAQITGSCSSVSITADTIWWVALELKQTTAAQFLGIAGVPAATTQLNMGALEAQIIPGTLGGAMATTWQASMTYGAFPTAAPAITGDISGTCGLGGGIVVAVSHEALDSWRSNNQRVRLIQAGLSFNSRVKDKKWLRHLE